MLDITTFRGEIPKAHPRQLPEGFAQIAQQTRLERGVLTPYRTPVLDKQLAASYQTIYRAPEGWLGWTADVDVVPGPVATDRLYYTGNGLPKMRVAGVNYNLKTVPPAVAPSVGLKRNNEFLTVDGTEVMLQHGRTATTVNGLRVAVTVVYNTAEVVVSSAGGLGVTSAQNLVNGLRYRNSATVTGIIPGLRIARITSLQDNGGQTFDANRNPIGNDTRTIDDIGSVINVANSPLVYDLDPIAQDGTDVAGQNDPPTLAVTALNPTYESGQTSVPLFSDAVYSNVEAGQLLKELRVTVDGLANAVIDPQQQETLVYAYTFVTQFGEESQPSPLSRNIVWSPGQSVRVNGMAAAGQGPRFTKKRIYRSATSASGGTDLYLIAEINEGDTFFDDVPDTVPLQEACPSLDYNVPPDALAGLTAMPNGMMVGFAGRDIYFCEPWQPHAWPAKYKQTTNDKIVGLATAGATLIVLTKGVPYVLEGAHPEAMRMERIEVNFPCIAKRSIVDLGYSVAYASDEGLVQIDRSGARMVTEDLFTPEQWRLLKPGTIDASQHRGRYVFSYDNLETPPKRDMQIIDLTPGGDPFVIRGGWLPRCWHFEIGNTRTWFMDTGGRVYQFDAPSGPFVPFRWRSAPFALPFFTNFGALLVEGDKITSSQRMSCKIFADGRLRHTETVANRVVRLPSGFSAKVWEVEIIGNFQIYGVHMARTVDELKNRSRV